MWSGPGLLVRLTPRLRWPWMRPGRKHGTLASISANTGLMERTWAKFPAVFHIPSHRIIDAVTGIGRSIIALNRRYTERRWPKTSYRHALRQRFPRFLCQQRRHIESGLSQHKRRLGSALTARGHQAQRRELILRVLTHNLMIFRSANRKF